LRLGTSRSGADVAVRIGRYGPYLERGEDRAPVPVDLAPDELTLEKAEELLDRGGQGPTVLGVDPDTGKPVYLKTGRFGPYVQLGDGDEGKPKMKSLLPGMVVETVTLEEALRLLGLPRLVGIDPDTGEEVLVDHGRYGPYVRRGTETRSLREAGDLFTVTLPEAQELLRQEKRGGRRAPQVLRELGPSPDGGEPIKLLAGRYGPYVTDGTVNASLPQGADAATFTAEQAIALLRE